MGTVAIMKVGLFLPLSLVLIVNVWAGELLNVSYDPTREFYQAYNKAFIKHWKETTGETLQIKSSHGGSGKQARSVIDGLRADVVTLALAGDIDAINLHKTLIDKKWASRLPYNSAPYTSTIVFLVRKGNPKQIKNWDDVIKENVEVITPNPKTSGGARWNFLAAWGFARSKYGNDEKAYQFVKELYRHTPILNTGARGATITFIQRELGDVLITWENEAYLSLNESGGDKVEIVVPEVSILAEPPVAVVDSVVDKKGTRKQAEAYLNYLYSEEGQRIAASHYFRPRDKKLLDELSDQFPPLKLFTVNEMFSSWQKVQQTYFADGAVFDNIMYEIHK